VSQWVSVCDVGAPRLASSFGPPWYSVQLCADVLFKAVEGGCSQSSRCGRAGPFRFAWIVSSQRCEIRRGAESLPERMRRGSQGMRVRGGLQFDRELLDLAPQDRPVDEVQTQENSLLGFKGW